MMWSNLPFDVLAIIFSYLSPDSLARARSACRNWRTCGNVNPLCTSPSSLIQHRPPWFVALPTHGFGPFCYVHDPIRDKWVALSLEFLSDPVRSISSVGGLILSRPTNCTTLQLVIWNPFTRQFRQLPVLNITRINPAIGVVVLGSGQGFAFPRFRVYVAGGMSKAPPGCGATYEPTLEMYDSVQDSWQVMGSMPIEFAVRLTIWTPNESVYCNGILYWITSARAYSVMGFKFGSNRWQELGVPMSDKLEFATLARHDGRLILVGGMCCGEACVWKLVEESKWCLIEKVPIELVWRFLRGKTSWGSTKCVSGDGAIHLYNDLRSGMIVWRQIGENGKWGWFWVEGCTSVEGKKLKSLSIRAVLIHPNLAPSLMYSS